MTTVSSIGTPLVQSTTDTMFSTIGSAGTVDPGDTGKVVFSNSIVQLGVESGGGVPSTEVSAVAAAGVAVSHPPPPQVSATIRYPISPADMPQIEVSKITLNTNLRWGSGQVLAALTEVAFFLHSGAVSEAVLLEFNSSGSTGEGQTEFVLGRAVSLPQGPGSHVCDSTKNAYYIALTLTGPQPLPLQLYVPPAVSAIWLTNV